jgi:hypothetical protein
VLELRLAQVAQGLEEHAGWERPLWQRHEKVRWQAWGRRERSWGENETDAKEIQSFWPSYTRVRIRCWEDSQALWSISTVEREKAERRECSGLEFKAS